MNASKVVVIGNKENNRSKRLRGEPRLANVELLLKTFPFLTFDTTKVDKVND